MAILKLLLFKHGKEAARGLLAVDNEVLRDYVRFFL